MRKYQLLTALPIVLWGTLSGATHAGTEVEALMQTMQQEQQEVTAQVTAVSELSDVQPTDWAFGSLQSLVERYGCIEGYPDKTYRGHQALSRYEFAAGLNACLDKINEILSAGLADKVTKDDLAALQRLQEEFAAELAALKGRVDSLDNKVAILEKQQFATTTKLVGEVAFNLAAAFRDNGDDSNLVLQNRVRLQLVTSFTGKDTLFTRLTFGNIGTGFTAALGTNQGRYAYDGQADNTVLLDRLHYVFPATDNLRITAMASLAGHHFYADTLNTGLEVGGGANGALTRFAERNPIYRFDLGGQGIGLNYQPLPEFEFQAGYIARGSENTATGLFGGSYSAMAQAVVKPTKNFRFAFNYFRGFAPSTGQRFGFGGTGTNLANFTANSGLPGAFNSAAVSYNAYGFQMLYDVTPGVSLRGWFGYTDAELQNVGNADILNYSLALVLPNLGSPGSTGAIIVGTEPYLTGLTTSGTTPTFRQDIPITLEAQYKYAIARNISITPGVILLFNRNQNSDNGTDVIATLRTTYSF